LALVRLNPELTVCCPPDGDVSSDVGWVAAIAETRQRLGAKLLLRGARRVFVAEPPPPSLLQIDIVV